MHGHKLVFILYLSMQNIHLYIGCLANKYLSMRMRSIIKIDIIFHAKENQRQCTCEIVTTNIVRKSVVQERV